MAWKLFSMAWKLWVLAPCRLARQEREVGAKRAPLLNLIHPRRKVAGVFKSRQERGAAEACRGIQATEMKSIGLISSIMYHTFVVSLKKLARGLFVRDIAGKSAKDRRFIDGGEESAGIWNRRRE